MCSVWTVLLLKKLKMYLHVYCFELNSSWLGFISLIEIKFYLMRVFLYVLKIVKQN